MYSMQNPGVLLEHDATMPNQQQHVDPQSANITSEGDTAVLEPEPSIGIFITINTDTRTRVGPHKCISHIASSLV